MNKHNMPEPSEDEVRRIRILDTLGATLTIKRREAVAARATCGIEQEWLDDEEFYQGYDDANRHEFVNTASKPTASGAPSAEPRKVTGSIVFPNITAPMVDAVAARVSDILMPGGNETNFGLEETPIPELIDVKKKLGQFLGAPQEEPQVPPEVSAESPMELAFKKMKAEAARKVKKAERRISDWLSECQYSSESRKLADDWVKLGSGLMKGPVPVKRKANMWQQGEDGIAVLVIKEEIKPGSKNINIWNFYPDFPACGENIHNGSFTFEYDQITGKKLEELKGLPGYIDGQIDQCLKEGPLRSAENAGKMNAARDAMSDKASKDLFDIWYFHGSIKREEMLAAGCECDEIKTAYPVMMTLVNDRVIRASLNPLDSGEFPYDLVPWKRRPNMPWGMGLARQLRTPQRIVTGATRRLMDNAGLASGPQIVIRRGVEPENNSWDIEPLKLWVDLDESSERVTSPVTAVVIPMLQVELTNIIQLGMKMAEDVTGMPMLLQGQQGAAPDTVGGMTILNNNANAVLRRVARLFDACITEPHIRRYYAWLMEYGEDDDEKGEFQVVAKGSTALVERDIQSQEMVNVLALCLNPAYKKNPEKAMDEYLKSRRFNPDAFAYTEAEMKQMAEQPPPPMPQVEVAKIRGALEMEKTDKVLAAKAEETDKRIAADFAIDKNDIDRDTAYVQAEQEKNAQQGIIELRKLEAQLELAHLAYAEKHSLKLEDVKAKLADTAIKANLQRELATMNAKQVLKPPVEPRGKAPKGQAYQK